MILGKLTEVLQAREQRLGTHQINPPIRFGIIEDKTINAFAQPNRQIIALNRGLIDFAESAGTPELVDAVLAGVLGHELAHIFYRHSSGNIQAQGVQAAGVGGAAGYFVHPLVGLIAGALVLDQQKAYDRMEEREADMLGIQLACEAGFDPTGLLILLQRMARDSNSVDFLQSHPSPQSRDEYLKSAAINCLRPEPATPKSTSNFSEPMVVYKADPAYTASARRAGVRGTLTVQAMIGVDGRAREITVLKGLGYGLEEEAIRTIETLWRFAPAKKDGVLIPSPMQINVVFQP
jgi:TonB family protein